MGGVKPVNAQAALAHVTNKQNSVSSASAEERKDPANPNGASEDDDPIVIGKH